MIEPNAHSRIGKLVQMEVGQKYFKIPAYEFFAGLRAPRPAGRDRIVKSLTSEPVSDNSFLWTTRVKEEELDPGSPWLVQDRVPALLDVTVVFVRDRMFSFALDRRGFQDQTEDSREVGDTTLRQWSPHGLPPDLQSKIAGYMQEIGLAYGRLDFLFDGTDYFFLEVNSNGEWDWLDPQGEFGLRDKMVEEIHPDTPLHGIPHQWRS